MDRQTAEDVQVLLAYLFGVCFRGREVESLDAESAACRLASASAAMLATGVEAADVSEDWPGWVIGGTGP